MMKRLLCWFLTHQYDWDEYYQRMEKEEHRGDPKTFLCKRCGRPIV